MPVESQEELIVADNVSFKYPVGKEPAIRNIDLKVKRGEFLLITGPTGAGKTTLVLSLMGLIPNVIRGEWGGQVTAFGYDTRITPVSKIASKAGIVFDDPEAQFVMGIVKYDVVYGMENFLFKPDEMRRRFAEISKLIRLEGLEERPSHQLSGGQKQRVAVASGLVLQPDVLILDEPTGQLDPVGRTEVLGTLRKLKERGFTIILVTHDVEEIIDIVDRMLVIKDGAIFRIGPPDEIFKSTDELLKLGVKIPQTAELVRRLHLKTDKVLLSEDNVYDLIKSQISIHKSSLNDFGARAKAARQERQIVLEVRDMSFRYEYPPVWALRGINAKISQGEFVALIGQNGSGKTTLAKHFNGLLKPTKGSVIVNGRDTSRTSVTELSRSVGYLFQFPSHQIFSDSVLEEIRFGLRNLGLKDAETNTRTDKALQAMDIENLRDMNPFFLSRGVQGKVAFASVIAMEPNIVVVDEPTTAQDWQSSLAIMNICKRLNESGGTIIVITHDMRLVAEFADRCIVMADGQIVFDGHTSDAFMNEDALKQAFIEPPPMLRLFKRMKADYELNFNISKMDQMEALLESR